MASGGQEEKGNMGLWLVLWRAGEDLSDRRTKKTENTEQEGIQGENLLGDKKSQGSTWLARRQLTIMGKNTPEKIPVPKVISACTGVMGGN